ncbi:hypothetical protein Pmani_012053 [Petrolisthes manimaculis]|uniref:RZ-type domain-containing protein n=1 Tax=Petrolisthes manimaculis TaxID=1843537 RepID=A0AAE1PZQ6_9EUCA|nr:hypothetical protein Pmani_012053 [Petrolisthes manimaculis]
MHPMGYKALESLASQTPDLIVLELLRTHSGFCLLLEHEDISPDKFDLLVKVLAEATHSQSNKEALYELFNKIMEMNFVDKLAMHSVTIKRRYPERANSFFKDVLTFLTATAHAMTTIAIDKLPNSIDIIQSSLSGIIPSKDNVNDNMVSQYEELQHWLTEEAKKFEHQQKYDKNKRRVRIDMDQMIPPDDFRLLPVLPSALDFSHNQRPFLRKNIVEGKYRDGNHYLDVQFRLLREDFVRPLRNGIHDFRSDTRKKINDVRIYRRVTISEPRVVGRKICNFVHMNQMNRIKLENSKRLLFGNLLCFSKDNFSTIILGSVADRDVENLKKGILGVEFESDQEFQDKSGEFVMIESRAYFMAYKHVLKALQEIPDDSLPLAPYIVHVEQDVAAPEYLPIGQRYDLRIIKKPTMMKSSEAYSSLINFTDELDIEEPVEGELMHLANIPIEEPLHQRWPTSEQFGLDDSQLRALRSALTKQLAIIQGPPGTGKTFLGLKIVHTLLHNSDIWKQDNPTPILVVCFTNHALDQFLEGMTSYTNRIVRVGSRTKSEVIEGFQINKLVRTIGGRGMPASVRERFSTVRCELMNLEVELNRLRAVLDECKASTGILSLQLFIREKVIPDHIRHQFERVKCDRKLAAWLLYNVSPQQTASFASSSKQKHSNDNIEQQPPTKPSDDKDDDDVEELLGMEERDRLLDVGDDDRNDDTPMLTSSYIGYEVRDQELVMELTELLQKYETDEDEAALLQCNIIAGQREVLQYGFNVPEIPTQKMEEKEDKLVNVWNLDPISRWQMYKYWLRKLASLATNTMRVLDEKYKSKARAMNEVKDQEYLHCMRNTSIVGMTTTAAAQYNRVLKDLSPAIVVVEEAAEILESHIITSLTANCKHLVMIGDHQQLRPSATVYELATKFGLETSLFERMIKNGLAYETLEYQHRMRPSISRLLVPAVYPMLKDHPSVHKSPSIKGLTKDVFFITHEINERADSDDNNSHENLHEAELVIGLCRHLMLQGYSPNDVTILTPYSGQFFLLRKLQRQQIACTGVRISVVDNFQGEENDIILLSLVRSNVEGIVGFLSTENRICVALSRAKHGLYVTGNIKLMSEKSVLWKKIEDDLSSRNCIGNSLTLQCSNHPDQLTAVTSGKEFIIKSPEGGCQLVCGKPLPKCNHCCPKICHMQDLNHDQYKCQVPCPKILCGLNHQCPKKCYQDCGPCMVVVKKKLPCTHIHNIECHIDPKRHPCPTVVEKVIPHCQHKVNMPCHKDPKTFPCPEKCDTRVDCGHMCRQKCHATQDPDHLTYNCYEKCTRINTGCTQQHPCLKKCYEDCGACTVKIKKVLPCQHALDNVECALPVENIQCKKNCKRNLPCGHHCKKLCHEKCGDCKVKVKRTIPSCGHEATMPCSETPTVKFCDGPCIKLLSCGHPCKRLCKDRCTDECMELVSSGNKCPNHHDIQLPCYLLRKVKGEDAWQYCKKPCNKTLECEHTCIGECGSCFQGRLHVACNKPCKRPLVCGHICKQPCSTACPPCQEPCRWKCVHSKCGQKCGLQCTPCKEPCEWKCEHSKCDNYCGDKCSRKPCNHPCKKVLKCGHPCIGFCGDPCPPLCRECNNDELTDIILSGNEDEPDARFVLLEDCGHTIEVEGLEGWLQQETAEIRMKDCPKCRSTIYNNRRYQHIILQTYQVVMKVKNLYNKHKNKNKITKKDIELILQNPKLCYYWPTEIVNLSKILGFGKKKHKYLNEGELQLSHFQAQVLEKAANVLQSCDDEEEVQSRHYTLNMKQTRNQTKEGKRLKQNLQIVVDRIMGRTLIVSPQMMKEVSCEIQRQMILPPYWKFQEKVGVNITSDDLQNMKGKLEVLMDPTVIFDEELDRKVRMLLKESEKYFGGLGISESERVMIVQAMGLKQGHWYKCPNDHIYCIGECGGAVMEAKCPYCTATIGGASHRLRGDNTLASEMDHARHAAWSQHYNDMGNFNLNNI